MNPLCLEFQSVTEVSPPELAELAAHNGLPFINLSIKATGDRPDWNLPGDAALRRLTRRRCEDLGIRIDTFEAFYIRPDTDVESLRAGFECGAWIGARRVVMVNQDPDEARLQDKGQRFCDLAAEHGLDVLLEYTPRMNQKTAHDALAWVRRLARPNLFIEADSLHTFRSGTTLDDLRELPQGMLARAQLCDGPRDAPADGLHEVMHARLLPGEGGLPLAAFVAALPPDIIIGLEVPNAAYTRAWAPAERVARIAAASRKVVAEGAALRSAIKSRN